MKPFGALILISLLSPALVLGASGPGDLTCDGIVDFDDIDPFVAALGCPGGDPNCWPGPCPWINGDCNDDGTVDFDDIDPFVALIGTTYPDPEGACCFADGSCAIMTVDGCADDGGVYEGDGTACDPNPCPQPEGACCYPDGFCAVTEEADCAGDWLGAGTDCDPNPCPQPEGACCYSSGSCAVTTEVDCTGDWQGADTDCDPNPCPQPIGACCYPDGSCALTTAGVCTGDWLGMGSDCDPNPCPQPLGACCYSDGSCAVTEAMDCTGDWQGMGTDCDPNPCPQPGTPTKAEIAGNSLSAYPYFEYVRAFNEDAPLKIALDPTRYPGIVGQTADVYVVEAQTESEWQLSPTLNDVTSDGPLTVTFSGGTIQANTFTVASAYELDSSVFQSHTGAYTGLGHGYDVVVDIDQDGQLSGADYIDGLSEEAGLYIVHDTAQGGPLAVTETIYSGGSWLNQDLYYPSNIGTMGQLPLIIVSHGNGHNYQWYDHIGYHMASYGYIVMSHSNETGPGIETASTTTLTNTDYLLGHLGSIAGGALNGHVDGHRIMWIGHSRGAEGIARAYDRLYDGSYSPSHFTLDDVILLSSMLPTDFLKTSSSNPHDANYHLWTASGDADVNGSASCDLCQTFHLHDRATRYRQSTVVQGTGHGDFHASSGSVFSGPCHIEPKSVVHAIMNGYFLPLAAHYMQGNVPGQDFLWRQYERFHPIGVD
ncbi:MAG: hypothetical protein JXB13_10045, partial [Phycisphaerae bacterium]|nr:hypothetical protein [Phycisphaerae bacterium]